MAKETDGELAAGSELKPLRYSECSVTGAVESISSDVILPDSRIKSIPENGVESNSGDITTEWNIDEQDDMFASVMCQDDWTDEADTHSSYDIYKTLKLGTTKTSYSIIKKFTQAPVEFQHFKQERVNQLQIALALNSFAKLTWSFMGSNHPKTVTSDPAEDCTYETASTTKSFKTLNGSIKIGDSAEGLVQCRQISDFSLTINNNMENTNALFETEAIESSFGDFDVTGSFDVWRADDIARVLSNDAIDGVEKYIQVTLEREVGGKTYQYIINLIVHLDGSSESKDGNKLKNTINFTVGRADGIEFVKTVK